MADEARILAERPVTSSESRRAFAAVKAHIFGLGRMMEIYQEPLGCYSGVLLYGRSGEVDREARGQNIQILKPGEPLSDDHFPVSPFSCRNASCRLYAG